MTPRLFRERAMPLFTVSTPGQEQKISACSGGQKSADWRMSKDVSGRKYSGRQCI